MLAVKDGVAEIVIDGFIGGSFFFDDDGSEDNNVARTNNAKAMRNELRAIAAIDAHTILVRIDNSPGGSVPHALSMFDQLAENPARIKTRTTGATASASTMLMQAADPGDRSASENTMLLFHRATAFVEGNADEIQSDGKDVQKFEDRMVAIYKGANSKGKTTAQIKKILGKNNGRGEWMTASEARAEGLVDTVFEPMKVAAMVDPKARKKLNLPKLPTSKSKKPNTMSKKNLVIASVVAFVALLSTKIDALVTDDKDRDDLISDIAGVAGCKDTDVQDILDGAVTADDMGTLKAFASVMDTTLAKLITESNDDEEEEEDEEEEDESTKDKITNWIDKNIKGKNLSKKDLKGLAGELAKALGEEVETDMEKLTKMMADLTAEVKANKETTDLKDGKEKKKIVGKLDLGGGDPDPGGDKKDSTGSEVLSLFSSDQRRTLKLNAKRKKKVKEAAAVV